ncbi:T9SS type A sorting domain-containing protein [Flavobacterium sp. IMCC34852]|uniref:T9SS type A sorting domain-containing protein n=1 Tax=Flavobacterium rivulicola TaxID=2732161 RepID=A0A7Y3VYW2_9FLAO|nr:T9SS type A sorting domain-containing protein [Flavobacterium sp. IMCC34852]NNT71866.1 T9SS type A sorting domain-containing protein [Flavobacterium sp. IMCC34852]
MKIKITVLLFSAFSICGFAQDKSYDLLRDKTETKILYDRVFSLSNATESKKNGINTNYFLQAYHEIQRADFLQRLPKLEKLREAANLGFAKNQVPLGVLIADFEKINPTAIENGDVFLTANNLFESKPNAQNVFQKHTLNLIAPLLAKSKSSLVTFIVKEELIFNTTNKHILSIAIQTNGEETWKTISTNTPLSIRFNSNGLQTVNCRLQFTNGETIVQSFVLTVDNQNNNADARNSQNNFQPNVINTITATIPYQGYGETVPHLGQGEYEIFPDTVDGVLDKPVFVVDGFDPGDTNTIPLFYAGLDYGAGQNLADYLRTQGFDIILVNFPTYTRPNTTTVVDGGVDFIQRNAFVLVEIINQINAQKVGTQKNVIIGPSMGGLISRYALRYMEMNALNHDTRLYISFDSPHQGANVPIGFQHLFNYMAYGPLGNAALQPIVDGMIKSSAARQMLIDHMEGHLQSGSNFEFNTASASLVPTGAPNYRTAFQNELNAMGFPTTVRNVAISNGAGNGTMNYSPNFEVMNHTFNVTTTQRAIINQRFTPAANVTNQVSRFRGQTLVFGTWLTIYESLANSKSPTYTDGLDTAPGGRFDMGGFQADAGTDPLLVEFFDNLNADYFTFIPTWSSMAISGTNNLYTPVTGNSVTPFVASSIPTVNENHVTLNQNNVTFALEEIINGSLTTTNPAFETLWIKNPVTNSIEINTSYTLENAGITINDILGKTIYQSKNNTISGTFQIPIVLTKGVYLITIGNENGSVTKKIVKD